MKDEDAGLREAYQAHMAAEGHVDDEAWERLGAGMSDEGEKARIADHVVRCAECARIWRAVHALDEGRKRRRAPTFARRQVIVAATALAAAAAVAIFLLVRRSGPGDDVVRGGATDRIEIEAAGPPERFAWKPIAGRVDGYRVRIFTDAGEPAWVSELLTGPPATPATPLPRGDYRWEVEALRDGGVVAVSRLQPFHAAR